MFEHNMGPEFDRYVDVDTGLGRVRGNKKLYRKMLNMFTESAEIERFEQAIADGDMEQAGQYAHAIKGMTGNLSLTALFDSSTNLMDQLRNGAYEQSALDHYHEALVKTQAYVNQFIANLDADTE